MYQCQVRRCNKLFLHSTDFITHSVASHDLVYDKFPMANGIPGVPDKVECKPCRFCGATWKARGQVVACGCFGFCHRCLVEFKACGGERCPECGKGRLWEIEKIK